MSRKKSQIKQNKTQYKSAANQVKSSVSTILQGFALLRS
nr:MAG TPA: hypothetical protein [Caudoviricetes sp.]